MRLRLSILLLLLCSTITYSQNFEGSKIENINITTMRINPKVVKNKFPLKEGQLFNEEDYQKAQDKLHDMRVFKELNFNLERNDNGNIDINIDSKDGYYVFPLIFFTGGSKKATAISLAEGNFFKRGETAFIFAATGDDGTALSGGLAIDDQFFGINYTNLNFEQRFYKNNWSSNYGIFVTADDKDKFGAPEKEIYTKQDYFSLMYARELGNLSAFIMPELEYIRYSEPIDNGNHNRLTFGLSYKENVRQGSNMGAMFGYGLSDKKKSLQNLPKIQPGYALTAAYGIGGSWTGADYNISKLTLAAQGFIEFKNRHIFNMALKAANSFNSPFSNEIRSEELLASEGRYSRQRRGTRGAGLSTSFVFYILRNDTGLLALQPFYELAYLYRNGDYYNQSGTGATVSYKFWRFPFPLGINYTHNLSDSSNQVAFVFGGKF